MINSQRTIRDIFDNLSDFQKLIAYELVGQALECGNYDREVLVVFNQEESIVIKYLLDLAMRV